MASVAHPVPSRLAHNVAVLFGHDDTLLAWQRVCAQVAEALRPQHDPERLSKALALAQGGQVARRRRLRPGNQRHHALPGAG